MRPGRPPCGTEGGYHAHRRRGQDACAVCKKAHAAYWRQPDMREQKNSAQRHRREEASREQQQQQQQQ